MDNQAYRFQGTKKFVEKGTYIFVVTSDEGDVIWTFASPALPIFDFGNTKIFLVETTGTAEVTSEQKKDGLYFRIVGVKVRQVYNFSYNGDEASNDSRLM